MGAQKHVAFRPPTPDSPEELLELYDRTGIDDVLLAVIKADPGVKEVDRDRARFNEDFLEGGVPR